MAALRFAAAGLLPGSLLAWEMGAHAKKVSAARERPPVPKLAEGSTLWLIEREAQTLDLVLFRRRSLRFGPSAAVADYGAQAEDAAAPYDGVGVVVRDRDGGARVLRARVDGSVSSTPLALALTQTDDYAEVALTPLVWPRGDRDSIENRARSFANGATLRFASEGVRPPWAALRDARVAPLLSPRTAWPAPRAEAALAERLDGAVSPAATLVVELLCACDLVAPQFRGAPILPADLLDGGRPPLRKGARYGRERLDVKAPNARDASLDE